MLVVVVEVDDREEAGCDEVWADEEAAVEETVEDEVSVDVLVSGCFDSGTVDEVSPQVAAGLLLVMGSVPVT